MGTEVTLPYSQGSSSGPYPEPDDFSPYACYIPPPLILLYLRNLLMFSEKYKLWISWLCNYAIVFIPLQSKYSHQHPVLKSLQSVFLPQCQRPNFTSIQNYRQDQGVYRARPIFSRNWIWKGELQIVNMQDTPTDRSKAGLSVFSLKSGYVHFMAVHRKKEQDSSQKSGFYSRHNTEARNAIFSVRSQ
jgi:hypothetical protein